MNICICGESYNHDLHTKYNLPISTHITKISEASVADHIIYYLSPTSDTENIFILGWLMGQYAKKLIVFADSIEDLQDVQEIMETIKSMGGHVFTTIGEISSYLSLENPTSIFSTPKPATVYDFIHLEQSDFDIYDTSYDICVTVCYSENIDDDYDRFINEITRKVAFVEKTGEATAQADWHRLIKTNFDLFKEFTLRHWITGYEDDVDEFIYQWIKEIHIYLAGHASDDFYSDLYEFSKKLK